MKRIATLFLQAVIVLIGIGTFALMLWEPNIEGRNVHSTLFEVYFKDPFLAYAYIASLSFFVALYQAFKVLEYVRQNKTFSQATVKALRTIKYSAITLVGFIVVPVAYLFIVRPGDDIAGGVAIGLFLIFVSIIIATVAAMFERKLENIVNLTSKSGLTS